MSGGSASSDKDSLMDRIGTHGIFQLRVILIVQFVGVFAGWQILSGSFYLPEVDYWCSPPELGAGVGERLEPGVSPVNDDNTTDHCLMVTDDNVTSCPGWDYDRSITPESVVSQFDLVCTNDYLRSLSSSVYMASKMLGSIVFGLLSDKFGRKRMIVVSSCLLAVAGVATSFAPNMMAWIVLRGVVALAGTGLYLCGFVYCMEMVGGVWSTVVSFGLEYSWAAGYLTVPLLAWALPRWNHLQLGISLPTLALTIAALIPGLVPESPRWLMVKGRKDEAETIITKIMTTNGRDIKHEMKPQSEEKREEKQNNGTLLDLLRSGPLLRCTLIMYYLWFTNNLVYYGFTLNAGSLFPGNLHINMMISAGLEFLAYTIAPVSFLYLGRRLSTSLFMGVCGLALILSAVLPTDSSKAAMAQVGKFMITASFAMVYQYATEMFPTVVRNAGIGSCSTFSRIGSIIAPFIGREMKLVSPEAPVLIFGFTSVLAGILTLFLPETKNANLPDTIKEGEEFCRTSKLKCFRKCC